MDIHQHVQVQGHEGLQQCAKQGEGGKHSYSEEKVKAVGIGQYSIRLGLEALQPSCI